MTKLTQLVLIAVLGISFCFAQINRGTLTGVITDPSGAVVPGVKITATHVETGTVSNTVASEGGSYTIPALPIGLYRIEFEATSFKKAHSQSGRTRLRRHAAPGHRPGNRFGR